MAILSRHQEAAFTTKRGPRRIDVRTAYLPSALHPEATGLPKSRVTTPAERILHRNSLLLVEADV
jgi:hypothetical protein